MALRSVGAGASRGLQKVWSFFGRKEEQEAQSARASGGSPINPANINVNIENAEKKGDDGTFWIILALIIFLMDMFYIPWLGDRYSGFTFAWWTVSFDIIGMIVTSSIFATFILINVLTRFVRKDYSFIPLLIIFFIITYTGRLLGYTFNFGAYYVYATIGLIVALIFFLKFFKGVQSLKAEDFAMLVFAFVYSFLVLNAGWIAEPKAVIHFLFITLFSFLFIKSKESNESSWYYYAVFLLLIDFFGYNLTKQVIALRYIPFLFFFVAYYVHSRTQNKFAEITGVIIFVVWFAVAMDDASSQGFSNFGWVKAEKPLSFTERVTGIGKSIGRYVESQLEYASGGMYRGFVEKNQFEPLGVFFDNIRAAQPRFYTDEDVTLWATIKSRTLSDPVIVTFSCFRWKDGKRISAEKNDIIIPAQPFTVYTLEEKDVECTFTQSAKESKIQAGTNTITLSAAYNFATSAYQKAYFIDKGRLRAMVKEGIDPLKEFGIADTTPKTIYTNGPVEIGMNIQNLIPVSDEIEVTPVLGISLINRDKITDKQGKILGEWQGKIKKINELIVVLPNGITINDPTKDCRPLPFKKIGKSDCPRSCSDTIYSPCIKSCGGSGKCAGECSDAQKKCVDECAELFTGDSENVDYEGYQLDVEQLKNKDEYKDIDRFKTFVCRIVPAKETLENVPITTKFIRTKARYDYLLEKSVNLIVEESPIQLSSAETDIFATNFNLQIPLEVYFDQNNKNEIQHSRIVFDAAQKYDVDYLFAKSIIQAESKWNPLAVGDNGNSFGLMQVSKELAASLGCSSDFNSNPISNVDCGVKHIRSLIDIQKNNNLKRGLKNIAAAYDCGQKALYYDTATGYENSAFWENPANCWSKDENTNTRAYVSRAMNNYNGLLKQLKSKKII